MTGQYCISATQIQKLYFENIATQIIYLNVYPSKHEMIMLCKCQKVLYLVFFFFFPVSLTILATMLF